MADRDGLRPRSAGGVRFHFSAVWRAANGGSVLTVCWGNDGSRHSAVGGWGLGQTAGLMVRVRTNRPTACPKPCEGAHTGVRRMGRALAASTAFGCFAIFFIAACARRACARGLFDQQNVRIGQGGAKGKTYTSYRPLCRDVHKGQKRSPLWCFGPSGQQRKPTFSAVNCGSPVQKIGYQPGEVFVVSTSIAARWIAVDPRPERQA